jgi:two-component system, OmpR family, osmolarity sensor histidine kinase EnvZ
MRRPLSLAQQNALRLIAVFVAFEAIVALAVAGFLMVPLAQRAATDFGELLALSAQTWSELPPMTRRAFEQHLVETHGIELRQAPPADAHEREGRDFYVRQVQESLAAQFGAAIAVAASERDGERWHWVAVPSGGRVLWVGFPHSRVGTQPLTTVLVTLTAGALLAILAAVWLARRIVAPLERLDAAAESLGRGERPAQLPETGPRELAALARRVNALGREVHDLLEGRTTLLAGLSHDLRTPLARMRLALEMLSRRPDPALIERLDRDIEEMNRLVGGMLELARGLGREAPREVDVQVLLEGLASQAREAGADVVVEAEECTVTAAPMALRRLLANLLSNAQRYGGRARVELVARRESNGVAIGVLDRGPGIPPDQIEAVFRPFHRVEASRSPGTGGAGLGLAIVRQLAQANGWSVALENRDGGGIAAWVTVPQAGLMS